MVGTRSSARIAQKAEKRPLEGDNDADQAEGAASKPAAKKAKAPKTAAKGRGKGKKLKEEEDYLAQDQPQDEQAADVKQDEEGSKAKSAAAKKVKGKGKANAKANVSEKAVEEKEEVKAEQKITTVTWKGKAPVDSMCQLGPTHHVFVDESGTVYDATLNQTNVGANNNKFYYVQLLESELTPHSYAVWTHWGRVGENGQSAQFGPGLSISDALKTFEKKFKDKTGLAWLARLDDPKPKKYTFIERDYEDDDKANSKPDGSSMDGKAEPEIKVEESELHPDVQNLMRLIFNTSFMQQSMASLSYDANKLPLGKLSQKTIRQGYAALKALAEVIEDPIKAQTIYGKSQFEVLKDLTSRYYTVIPHVFGRSAPPVINNAAMLKRELDLVENLGDMEIATEIMESSKAATTSNGTVKNPLDSQYASLKLSETSPLDPKSEEYKQIAAYLEKTHGPTHKTPLKIESIFRIARPGEEERFEKAGFSALSPEKDDRRLLWHASRVSNFGGILSQGLRIAPPEAPVTGYDYGKGVYFGDMVSKSCGYCRHSISGNTGLLLLCEVQLGKPQYESWPLDPGAEERCKAAQALATKGPGKTQPVQWMDAGVVHETLKGVQMPSTKGNPLKPIPPPPNARTSWDKYTEYIVYSVAQIKLKYLLRCRFDPSDSHYD